MSSSTMEQDLAKAEVHILSNRNDSAILVLNYLERQLTAQQQMDSPFGLQVQLLQGTAFEKSKLDTIGIYLLLHVKEQSRKNNLWETYAKSCLALAVFYERGRLENPCNANLREAQEAIQQNGLDAIYPDLCIRKSSYYRMIVRNQDSAVYFAQEALRTAPEFNLPQQEAWAHLLLAMLYRENDPVLSLKHAKAAVPFFRKIEDYEGLSAQMNNLAIQYFTKRDYKNALLYNDSSIIFKKIHTKIGNRDDSHAIHQFYQFRGDIFKSLGQIDSAWYYLYKAYRLQYDSEIRSFGQSIIEKDARFNNEKNAQEIAAQAQGLKIEKLLRNLLLIIILIVLALGSALAYFYQKLQKANQKTEIQAEQLKSLDAAKSHFFANLSHELRTPLNLILAPISSLLKENRLNPQQIDLLQMATRNGERLSFLINEILHLRKLDADKMELQLQPTPLSMFFRRNLAQFETLAYSYGVDFSFNIALDDHVVANIDREKCRQIVYNLLSNAFKFTPKHGKVEVDITLQPYSETNSAFYYFNMAVVDTGRGIHPNDLPQVFDRFFQTYQHDKPSEGGTGIGLALCREYVELFGGKISVESHLDKGSSFYVHFPVEVLHQEATPPLEDSQFILPFVPFSDIAPANEMLPDATKPTLLIVEDNPDLQQYLQLVLNSKYNVRMAGNGQEALVVLGYDDANTEGKALSTAIYPDLIISDLMMPIMDGYQLLQVLKSSDTTRHIPVIMLTARAEAPDRMTALRIGVDDYMTKPFDEEELLIRIENLLKNRMLRQSEAAHDTISMPSQPIISQSDCDWLESFEVYIQQHFADDHFSIPALAQTFAMSESTLLRQLKRLTGLSPAQYIQEIRLNEARLLLENRVYNTIAQVATKVGYSDTRPFSRSFQKRFGKSPSEILKD